MILTSQMRGVCLPSLAFTFTTAGSLSAAGSFTSASPSGTRRWLPFEVDSILSPRDFPFDYEGIYAQAYALYRQGFSYYFSEAESKQLQRHNQDYEVPSPECELIDEYFRKPRGAEVGEFISTTVAAQLVSTPGVRVTSVEMGRAFSRLRFRSGKRGGSRGYYVVRILPEERRQRAVSAAYDALTASPPEGQMDR